MFDLLEVKSIFRHCVKWLFSKKKDLIYTRPEAEKIPPSPDNIHIYCIHGTADGNASFVDVAQHLIKHVPSPIESIHLVHFNQRSKGISIADYAQQLADTIKKNGHKNVIIMGHSRGGLVAAHYAEYLAKKNGVSVKSVVSVCSPFQGTALALPPLTHISTSIDEMQVDSAYLNQLNEKINTSDVHYLPFAATEDAIVAPDRAAPNAYHKQLITLDNHGHLSIMTSHRLISAITSHVRQITGHEFSEMQSLSLKQHLQNLFVKLDDIILGVEMRMHLFSNQPKIQALHQLQQLLLTPPNYTKTHTIGDVLEKCLHTKFKFDKRHTILDIINQSLNPFTFCFFKNTPKSSKELFELIEHYKKIPLVPPKDTVVAGETPINFNYYARPNMYKK